MRVIGRLAGWLASWLAGCGAAEEGDRFINFQAGGEFVCASLGGALGAALGALGQRSCCQPKAAQCK